MDDWTQLKCLKEDRQIYAIKVVDYLAQENKGNPDSTIDMNNGHSTEELHNKESLMQEGEEGGGGATNSEFQSCVICMEDLPCNELRQHNACDCVMCLPCLERTIGKAFMHIETDAKKKKIDWLKIYPLIKNYKFLANPYETWSK